MSKKSTKTTARRSAQTGTFEIIHRAEQSLPLRILAGLVRLRAELALFTTVVVAWALLDAYVTPGLGAWVVLGGLVLAVAAIPHTRRYAMRRFWSIYTRHRVRACLVNSRVTTHEGQVPRLLWARPIPVGVRVWVLLRAGLAGRHIEHVTDEIAAACLAREARVHIHDRWTAFVRIDVVRHDPLSGKADVASDLLTGRDTATDSGADVIPLPDRTTVTPEPNTTGTGGAPTTDAPATRRAKTRTTTPTTTAESDGSVAMGRSGEDVSDYV
ncbi:MAG: hypothetical protein GEV09_05575 [Pseudonocardiaceae bacterium]|nr:hypothetical protein [Pseudonocardiaceae bacterium]